MPGLLSVPMALIHIIGGRAFKRDHRRSSTASVSSFVLIDYPPPDQARELEWMLKETSDFMTDLKHGLQDCYALLAPVDPGSTLVLTTPRAEKVKGLITRVGTRIVKGVCSSPMPTYPLLPSLPPL